MIFYLCIYLSTISRGVQTTALIPLVVKASETLRENPHINDPKALDIIRHLNIDTKQYDKFLSHEGVRTIMLDRKIEEIIEKHPDTVMVNIGASFDNRFSRVDNGKISCYIEYRWRGLR